MGLAPEVHTAFIKKTKRTRAIIPHTTMAQKQKKKRQGQKENPQRETRNLTPRRALKDETKHSVIAIIFFALSLFYSRRVGESPASLAAQCSVHGHLARSWLLILPLLSAMLGISFYKSTKPNWVITKVVGECFSFFPRSVLPLPYSKRAREASSATWSRDPNRAL